MAKKAEQSGAAKSKTEVVKELLAKGLKRPMDISAEAKTQFGMEIAPNYVSMIKTGLKKNKRKGRRAVKGDQMVSVASRKPRGGSGSGDLSLENLALRFALKAGSIDAAVNALEKLR